MPLLLCFLISSLCILATAKQCINVIVPVDIQARQGIFNVPELWNNADATWFAQNFTSIGRNFTDDVLVGYRTVTGAYNNSARFCGPDSGIGANAILQFSTHGMGFDKSYWDLPFNAYEYSYIGVAVDKYGFCTVSIDRLGIGNSSHADPLNVVQAPAEVSAMHEVTKMLRGGTVKQAFDRIVHVGHSFGSLQSYLLSTLDPSASDALILTAWSNNHSWLPGTLAGWNVHLARLNQPLRFGDLMSSVLGNHSGQANASPDPVAVFSKLFQDLGITLGPNPLWNILANTELGDIISQANATAPSVAQYLPSGYLTWSDYTANQFAFLTRPFFDPAVGFFSENTKQPVTVGELFTLGNGAPATTPFTGPVLVFTGRQDMIYCGGGCIATGGDGESIPGRAKGAFTSARSFEAYIQPDIGHTINFHYIATGTYEVIQERLIQQGFGGS